MYQPNAACYGQVLGQPDYQNASWLIELHSGLILGQHEVNRLKVNIKALTGRSQQEGSGGNMSGSRTNSRNELVNMDTIITFQECVDD